MAELSNKQMKAAEILVTQPEKKLQDVAKELNVTETTLWRWRQRSDFKEYESQLCHQRFLDLERLAIQKLKENVKKNNQRAIEYALDYAGYKTAEKVDLEVNRDVKIIIED